MRINISDMNVCLTAKLVCQKCNKEKIFEKYIESIREMESLNSYGLEMVIWMEKINSEKEFEMKFGLCFCKECLPQVIR